MSDPGSKSACRKIWRVDNQECYVTEQTIVDACQLLSNRSSFALYEQLRRHYPMWTMWSENTGSHPSVPETIDRDLHKKVICDLFGDSGDHAQRTAMQMMIEVGIAIGFRVTAMKLRPPLQISIRDTPTQSSQPQNVPPITMPTLEDISRVIKDAMPAGLTIAEFVRKFPPLPKDKRQEIVRVTLGIAKLHTKPDGSKVLLLKEDTSNN